MNKMGGEPGDGDPELMKRYLEGDFSAFERLYRRYSGRVYAYLQRRVAHPEEADEVFQSVFLKFHQSRSQYDPAFPLLQWLYVIARTSLLDHLRKQGRQVPIAGDVLLENVVSREEADPALITEKEPGILKDLPTDQREAIKMRVMEELSYEQIAQRLGKSQESVRQMVSRAIRRLRVSLGAGGAR